MTVDGQWRRPRQTQFSAGLLSTVLNATYHVEIRSQPTDGLVDVGRRATQPVTNTLVGLGMSCGTASLIACDGSVAFRT